MLQKKPKEWDDIYFKNRSFGYICGHAALLLFVFIGSIFVIFFWVLKDKQGSYCCNQPELPCSVDRRSVLGAAVVTGKCTGSRTVNVCQCVQFHVIYLFLLSFQFPHSNISGLSPSCPLRCQPGLRL